MMFELLVIFLCTVLVSVLLVLLLFPPSFFTWDELYGENNINDAYRWLEFDPNDDSEFIEFQRQKINGRLAATAFKTEFQAIQVNPRCIHQDKFLRACWNMYGTGRNNPDPEGSPNGSVAPLY